MEYIGHSDPQDEQDSMELHRLRVFVAIVRSGGFTRASEQLFLTQPTVSQQLALLEQEIGARLLERGGRRVRLTPAGEALLPRAEQILRQADAAREEARAAAGLADRTLRLGVGHLFGSCLLPDLLLRFRAAHPERQVRITMGNTGELLQCVADDRVEVALVGAPARLAGVEVTPFLRDRIVAIVAVDDPWAGEEQVAVGRVWERTLFVREPGSALHAAVERLLPSRALAGEKVIQLAETEAIKRCVEAGLGVALIQEIAVRREVAAGTLRTLRLAVGDDTREYAWARRAGAGLSPAARDMVALLSDAAASRVEAATAREAGDRRHSSESALRQGTAGP